MIGEGWLDLVKFLAAQLLGGIIILGVMILVQCLAFIFGNAEGIAQQVQIALITFTTYPIDIFSGVHADPAVHRSAGGSDQLDAGDLHPRFQLADRLVGGGCGAALPVHIGLAVPQGAAPI